MTGVMGGIVKNADLRKACGPDQKEPENRGHRSLLDGGCSISRRRDDVVFLGGIGLHLDTLRERRQLVGRGRAGTAELGSTTLDNERHNWLVRLGNSQVATRVLNCSKGE